MTTLANFAQAAQCKEPAAQASLLRRLDDMSAEVADAGISLKYSKKVRRQNGHKGSSTDVDVDTVSCVKSSHMPLQSWFGI